jgi:hypothetical protein
MDGLKPKRTRSFDIRQGVVYEQAFVRLPLNAPKGEQENGGVWLDQFVLARYFFYSTVTLFARFRGWSTSNPRMAAM